MHVVGAGEPTAQGDGPVIRLPQCRLVVREGNERGREVVVASDVIRVGKSRDNDLTLDEETVSRVHFEIVRDPKGYLVRDLRSTNGTFVDGAEIKEAYVRAGAVISAGAVRIEFQPLEERLELVPLARETLGDMCARSASMRTVFAAIERVAATDAAVLFTGEAGTGKRLAALTLHRLSRRRAGPLVEVDCASATPVLPAQDAVVPGSTLLLEAVDELPRELEPRLLRLVTDRELRVLSTARRSLGRLVERGRFPADLRFRLEGVSIGVPALRHRREDVAPLAERFLDELGAAAADGLPLRLPDEVLAALGTHDWPGNVSELRALVGRWLSAGAVAGGRAGGPDAELGARFDPCLPFRDQKERFTDEFERRYLTWLLRRADGNVSRAARSAEMDRKYLHKLLRKHGLGGES